MFDVVFGLLASGTEIGMPGPGAIGPKVPFVNVTISRQATKEIFCCDSGYLLLLKGREGSHSVSSLLEGRGTGMSDPGRLLPLARMKATLDFARCCYKSPFSYHAAYTNFW